MVMCENILTFKRHLKIHLFQLTQSSCAASSASVSSDLKALYKSVIIIIIIGNGTVRQVVYEFLFVFHICGRILYSFGDKARYWQKIAIFFISTGPSITPPPEENGCKYFMQFFSQPSYGLVTGVNRFCKKSCVYSQLTRVTGEMRSQQRSDNAR